MTLLAVLPIYLFTTSFAVDEKVLSGSGLPLFHSLRGHRSLREPAPNTSRMAGVDLGQRCVPILASPQHTWESAPVGNPYCESPCSECGILCLFVTDSPASLECPPMVPWCPPAWCCMASPGAESPPAIHHTHKRSACPQEGANRGYCIGVNLASLL